MNGKDQEKPGNSRDQRLKQALKDNLQRRKAQARARADAPAEGARAPQGEPDSGKGQDG